MPQPRWRSGDVVAAALVFIASAAVLVLELASARLLAPIIGVSLHTWTSIIGVALLGISGGSFIGGRLARGGATARTVAVLLGAAGVLSAIAPWWVGAAEHWSWLRAIPVLPRTFLLSFFVLAPPSVLLSAVMPIAVQWRTPDVRVAGHVAGALNAGATLGGLAGNFLTGLVFLARFELATVTLFVGGALLLCAAISFAAAAGRSTALAATPSEEVEVEPEFKNKMAQAYLLAAAASFQALLVEIAASRLIAPHLGASLITWTCVLGVVLAGIATGNYLGGWIADKKPSRLALATSLLVAGIVGLLMPPVHQALVNADAFASFGLVARTLAHTAAVFLLPVMALGTISPQVVRLSLRCPSASGETVGRIAAWSTVGALMGTFLTGWWLLRAVGVNALVAAGSSVMILGAAWLSRPRESRRLATGIFAAAAIAVSFAWIGLYRSPCTEETDYFCINVYPLEYRGRAVKAMRLDMLVHTLSDLKDPSFLGYPYNYVQADFVRHTAAKLEAPRVLVIGGGGYVVPRWIEAALPNVSVDVVEIDPAVTRIALSDFGVKTDTKIRSFNLDGRLFVQEQAERGAYDLVMIDAVNDLSVPYHLVTKQHAEHIAKVMKPNGVFLLTVIDDIPRGAFLRSVVRTMQSVYPNVALLRDSHDGPIGQSTYVVAGSAVPLDVDDVRRIAQEQAGETRVIAFTQTQVDDYLAAGASTVLTDSYAPVDNMLAELFLLREKKMRAR